MTRVTVANDDKSSAPPFSISVIQRRRPTCAKQPFIRYQTIRSRICSISTKALKIQLVVVRNAAGCIACAWLTSVCYSFGNIFSGKPSYLQSRDELIVANSVWSAVAFCTIVLASYTPLMLSLRFLNEPDQPPTLWYCFIRLARATIIYFIATIVATFAFGYFVVYLAQIEPTTFIYRLECYADIFSLIFYFTGIAREVKRIYYEETCQGHDKLMIRKKKIWNSSNRCSSVAPQTEALSVPVRYRAPVFWKSYVKQLPSFVPPMLATVAVHVLSRLRIVEQGSVTFSLFFTGAIAFKLAIQELSKLYVVKKRIQSTRVMCILVGVPTVLIDTQTRIILSGGSNTRTAVKGVLGMALIEILFRLVKAKMLERTITQRQNAIFHPNKGHSTGDNLSMPVEFQMWKQQLHVFHIVELNADMYAEYIAIGCSGSILFFFGTHPHYPLLRQSYSAEEIVDLSTWRLNQLYILGLQFGVEAVVDYISIALEMATGLEFDHVNSLGSFLAVFFMVTAVTNLTISIGIYLT